MVEDAIAKLLSLGLLEQEEDGSLLLHRLVALFLQGQTKGSEVQEAVEAYVPKQGSFPHK